MTHRGPVGAALPPANLSTLVPFFRPEHDFHHRYLKKALLLHDTAVQEAATSLLYVKGPRYAGKPSMLETTFASVRQSRPRPPPIISCLSFLLMTQLELCRGRVQPAPLIPAFAGILPLVYGLGNLPPAAM